MQNTDIRAFLEMILRSDAFCHLTVHYCQQAQSHQQFGESLAMSHRLFR